MASMFTSISQVVFSDAKTLKDSVGNMLAASDKIIFAPSTSQQIVLFNSILKNYFPDSTAGVTNDSALYRIIKNHLR